MDRKQLLGTLSLSWNREAKRAGALGAARVLVASAALVLSTPARAQAPQPPSASPAPPVAVAPAAPAAPGAVTPPPAAPAASAAALSYELAGASLRVRATSGGVARDLRDVPLGCEGRGLLRDGTKLYVACGTAGVARLDLADPAAPVLEGRTPVGGEAVSVFLLGQKPWVEIARREARPVDAVGIAGAPAVAHASATGVATVATTPRESGEPTPAARPSESRVAPTRVGDVWDVAVAAQLFLPFGTIGFGALGEAEVVKRFDIPLAIHLQAKPAGFGAGKQGGVGTAVGVGVVALDTQFLELGLGLGAATVNDRQYSSTGALSDESSSVVVAQLVRIGARDGLAFDGRATIIVRRDNFQFGTFDGSMQIPLASRWHFITGGGGGVVGYGYGHAGARYRLSETTKAGSFAISGSAGVAGIFGTSTCVTTRSGSYSYLECSERSYIGPALRVGLEWRL